MAWQHGRQLSKVPGCKDCLAQGAKAQRKTGLMVDSTSKKIRKIPAIRGFMIEFQM